MYHISFFISPGIFFVFYFFFALFWGVSVHGHAPGIWDISFLHLALI